MINRHHPHISTDHQVRGFLNSTLLTEIDTLVLNTILFYMDIQVAVRGQRFKFLRLIHEAE